MKHVDNRIVAATLRRQSSAHNIIPCCFFDSCIVVYSWVYLFVGAEIRPYSDIFEVHLITRRLQPLFGECCFKKDCA